MWTNTDEDEGSTTYTQMADIETLATKGKKNILGA